MRTLGLAALVILGACAGGDDDSLVEPLPTTAESATDPDDSESDPSERGAGSSGEPPATVAPDVAGASTTTTTTTTLPLDSGEPFGENWGLPELTQLTPLAGGGPRPLFEWEPIEGADGYMMWVYSPDGSPYWSWMGSDTSTYLGGAIRLADDRPGPRVIDGMSWVIAAVDTNLEFLAVSEQRWIGP